MPTPAPTLAVIRADLSHVGLLAPLFDAYRVFYGQPSEVEAAKAFLAARLLAADSVVWLAFFAGEPAGFTQLYPSFSSVSLKPLWILNDLFVAPEARNRGVAGALLDHAYKHACETGAKGLTLQTAADNRSARALYEAHGWQKDTRFLTYTRSA